MFTLSWNLLVGLFISFFAISSVVAVSVLVFSAYLYLCDRWQKHYFQTVCTALKTKPYFYNLHFGVDIYVSGDGYETFVEAPLSVILAHRGRPAAVISFRLLPGRKIQVVQMQGLKKANLHGVDVGQWLVEIVEEVAEALRCREVQIVKASKQTYYGTIAGSERSIHQARMRQRYDAVPSKNGYKLKGRWWQKCL